MIVLTYHAVQDGPAPLCVDPRLFAEHARVIAGSGVVVLTVREVAAALRAGTLPQRGVAITFDDGYASVVEHAAPVLHDLGLRPTIFCVAGHVGGESNWPTQASWAPRLRLAHPEALRELAAEGWEIGAHGVGHAPLSAVDDDGALREVVESQRILDELTGVRPTSFAWPYGARPTERAAALIGETYDAACAAGPRAVHRSSDPLAVPRIDVNYLLDPDRLRRALEREPRGYLALRRSAGRLRRVVRPDFST